jgi:hypothetical protein
MKANPTRTLTLMIILLSHTIQIAMVAMIRTALPAAKTARTAKMVKTAKTEKMEKTEEMDAKVLEDLPGHLDTDANQFVSLLRKLYFLMTPPAI